MRSIQTVRNEYDRKRRLMMRPNAFGVQVALALHIFTNTLDKRNPTSTQRILSRRKRIQHVQLVLTYSFRCDIAGITCLLLRNQQIGRIVQCISN